mmetsp:Transcript_51300/g.92423  ORF Transcript_51300/g.92423 Transcript_51300/m.92423 type:complete len:238 (-) Transcript_51300:454-1167(-)
MAKVLRAVAFAASLTPSFSYYLVANCVPGSIVASLNQTQGRVGLYTKALQTILPSTYGDLKLLAKGTNCMSAASAVNSNSIILGGVLDNYKMENVGLFEALTLANVTEDYLYVFETKGFVPMQSIADCVPGDVVASLNQTKGFIVLYTKALQQILPGIFGDLKFLGVAPNASACNSVQNMINTGRSDNATYLSQLKNGTLGLKEVAAWDFLKKGDGNFTYMYVFDNVMWNKTTEWWV